MLENKFKSGFVTILGRPNAGKSTLLNALIDNKVSIISPIPQTTRHQIKGILNLENAQIVFVDTPGIHSFEDKLAAHLNTVAKRAIEGCDLIIYVVDMSRRPGKEEQELMRIISNQKIKTIMVLNKIDLGLKHFNAYIDLWTQRVKGKKNPLVYYIPLSAKTGQDVDKLRDALIDNLPEAHPYYETNSLTDFPIKFRVADIIREKLFLQLNRELPHSIAVEIEEINNKKKIVSIRAIIYVKRNSQKRIVIGKSGEVLKEVGWNKKKAAEKLGVNRTTLYNKIRK